MNRVSYIFQTVFKGLIIAIVLFFVIVGIQYFMGRVIQFDSSFVKELMYYVVYGIVLTFLNSSFFDLLHKRIDWKKYSELKRYKILIGFIGSIIVTLIGILCIRFCIKVLIERNDFSSFIETENKEHYIISLIITIVISLLFHLFYFYKNYQENRVKQERIIAGTASAQFESLKNQIDPHFLFNSLNVLSSLIEENPEQAQKFTTSLSKIYRYVLEQRDKELVTVQEEINFARTYMNLLKMRFENSISFELPEHFDTNEAKVVPLSLQLLLENCIKHNIVSEQKPLHIKIYLENSELVIENNKQIKEVLRDRKGVGLQNIVNRYAIVTDRRVSITEDEMVFKVKLPVLTKQVTIMETINNYNEDMAYVRAKDKVKNIREFYGSLISYCVVIPVLIFINLKTSDFQWFWFPAIGWGIGLLIHGVQVFGFAKDWEEKKINEIMNRDNNKKFN